MSVQRFMLDTNTVSYLLRDRSQTIQTHLLEVGVGTVCISAITEAELRFGLRQRPAASKLKVLVDSFLARVDSLPWGSEAARYYGELRHHSKVKGFTLSNMDMLIGAHAIAAKSTLVTNEGAFSHLSEWIELDNLAGE